MTEQQLSDLVKACNTICTDAKSSPNAKMYAGALTDGKVAERARTYGRFFEEAVHSQCLYLLTNLTHWRHPEAKAIRTLLKSITQ